MSGFKEAEIGLSGQAGFWGLAEWVRQLMR